MASILYSHYISKLEHLQKFERKITTPPFYMMFLLALFIHILLLLLWSFVPDRDYFSMPVNALKINVGNGKPYEEVLNQNLAGRKQKLKEELEKRKQQIVSQKDEIYRREQASMEAKRAAEIARLAIAAKKHKKATSEPSTRTSRVAPSITPMPWANQRSVAKVSAPVEANPSPAPQQDIGTGIGAGDANAAAAASSASEQEKVMLRYEQKLSAWIDRNKIYPFEAQEKGLSGKVLLRIRIDRAGNVKIIKIQKSSGFSMLDSAVIHAARRSNPVPSVPASYPGGHLLEFIIPISFEN